MDLFAREELLCVDLDKPIPEEIETHWIIVNDDKVPNIVLIDVAIEPSQYLGIPMHRFERRSLVDDIDREWCLSEDLLKIFYAP